MGGFGQKNDSNQVVLQQDISGSEWGDIRMQIISGMDGTLKQDGGNGGGEKWPGAILTEELTYLLVDKIREGCEGNEDPG